MRAKYFKGQYFSFDAIMAAVIFIMALMALLSYWHSVKAYLDHQNDELTKEAVRISNLLFTPPAPASSDCNGIERLGLSNGWDDRRINSSILNCAKGKDEAWLKQRLGTPFEVSIVVLNLTATPEAVLAEIGEEPPADASEVRRMRRLATLVDSKGNTDLVAVDLSLYSRE